MSGQRVGQTVTVRGANYRVTRVENLSHLGARWFGQFRFTLTDAGGAEHRCSGKRIAHNSKLTPSNPTTKETS